METNLENSKNYELKYNGKGDELFGIIIVNWLLSVLTLGFYYPWAKAKQLKYLYGSTSLNADRFAFTGTGKEMFKGFIKAILIFVVIYGATFFCIQIGKPFVGILILYAGILALLPFAIHGSYKYRMSRTTWRNIRFGYKGNRKEFVLLFFKGLLFTILTFGIYGAWFAISIRKYIGKNIGLGSLKFNYEANGLDYFLMNLKGYLLTIFTLGIYMFWWQKNMFNFYINNLSGSKGEDEKIEFNSTATGGGIAKLMIVNLLIVIVTLGFGAAWAITRTMNYFLNNIQISGNVNLDSLDQTEANYTDATSEDISDFLDLEII